MADLEIGVIGAAGRMGAAVVREISGTEGCVLVAAADDAGHPALGEDAGARAGLGALGVPIGDDPARVFERSGVVIEFSLPDATARHAAMAGAAATPHVIGTTGLDAAQERAVRDAAASAPIVLAPNMSLAVNILFALTRQVARNSRRPLRHRDRRDAPQAQGRRALRHRARARAGPPPRAAGSRSMRSRRWRARARPGRAGRAISVLPCCAEATWSARHTVTFAVEGERLELTHKAASRQIFSRGAVHAARWAPAQPPGLYGMADVLGL